MEWQDQFGSHLPALEAMAKQGRRIRALETRPRLPRMAQDALRVWDLARLSRRSGFNGPETLDPSAVLACIDAYGRAAASSRGDMLRLVMEHDANWLGRLRARREAESDA